MTNESTVAMDLMIVAAVLMMAVAVLHTEAQSESTELTTSV